MGKQSTRKTKQFTSFAEAAGLTKKPEASEKMDAAL